MIMSRLKFKLTMDINIGIKFEKRSIKSRNSRKWHCAHNMFGICHSELLENIMYIHKHLVFHFERSSKPNIFMRKSFSISSSILRNFPTKTDAISTSVCNLCSSTRCSEFLVWFFFRKFTLETPILIDSSGITLTVSHRSTPIFFWFVDFISIQEGSIRLHRPPVSSFFLL